MRCILYSGLNGDFGMCVFYHNFKKTKNFSGFEYFLLSVHPVNPPPLATLDANVRVLELT